MKRARTPPVQVVLYPGGFHSRTLMHAFAAIVGIFFVFRMATGGPAWMAVAWYAGTFVGFHAVMVPVMTAWHALLDRAQRYLRGRAEEEALRVDMSAYRSRLQNAFPIEPETPPEG